jgi:hypothetical protein
VWDRVPMSLERTRGSVPTRFLHTFCTTARATEMSPADTL